MNGDKMDKRKSILNVTVSVGFKILTMAMVIVVKRFLIQYCGNDVNGLNALYLSIIGFLAVAELGVGSAITFCMYKPIVEGDKDTVSALYHLFRRVYLVIGGVILLCGLIITPFITVFAKDYAQLDVNLYLTFVLMLLSVVITYLYSCKTSLINAYKNNYVTTAITSSGLMLQYVLQIVVLLITKSFVWYLICRIVAALAQWVATEYAARRNHTDILTNPTKKIEAPVKKELMKNIKAMFMHSIGYVLVNSVGNVVISAFIGVGVLGLYSNYTMILTSLTEVLKLVFTSLTSVIGHLYVEANKQTTKRYCENFHLLNFVLGCVFFLGYYAVADDLIALLFAEELIIDKTIVLVLTINGFVQFMRQSTLVFRQATGTFYYDRWKPLLEGIVNVVLAILLVHRIGVAGVLLATIITNLVICHIIEPFVLYKNAFGLSPKLYYLKNYGLIVLFCLALGLLHCCTQSLDSRLKTFLANGFISVGISLVTCGIVLLFNRDACKQLLTAMKGRLKK